MQRGDVYRLKVPKGVGHEQQGERFGVVVQSDVMLPRSVVIVAPTSRSARPASFRPEVEVVGEPTRVLVEQLGAVDVQRLGRRVGRLAVAEMWSVDEALVAVLGLD
ncbi:MAG: type II toxin-antitoxin system PemK/MazF family toxin [Acidimicrobiaceae bacterium]|nr:type II toxin-antitoxin system PemK/MazF family toxin [Ilumatobacter sp.]MCB9381390.1 type II toxin-antitoxin system PemK/MazF family toxin [Acidimicrobiaceae bacterium]MCO5330294.1 type II toxin-antitoxin system PemK/MazF family toxin [Ilumatobacteraceae bacterium]